MASVKEERNQYLFELYGEISILRSSVAIVRDRVHPVISQRRLDSFKYAGKVRDTVKKEFDSATLALATALDRVNQLIEDNM